jgi:two-component system, LytTR family, response regulator
MALTVYLVDDEELALKRLARLLTATERVEIVGMSTDPVEASAYLTLQSCDVLFLDIEMPVLTGFDLLTQLNPQPTVVFTTAYSQYALQAFETNSIDYLLKPIEPQQLDRALNKIERFRGEGKPSSDLNALLTELKASIQRGRVPSYPSRVSSKVGDKIELIELSRITHFYAEDKLTFAATPTKSHILDSTIADLERTLDPARFVRIHRSTLVNIDFVQEVHSWFGGRLVVRLNDGKRTELSVARDRVRELKQRLNL